ncbi:hypothetical protein PHYPSEUDO_010015 [Phytophthora pseudosyringae]|uniref:Uncharacterized protein n=1 Tax=Phytophthora pseudosyringae TaxID=221518 RepID=A0A8T1WA50_9STRA|nr:hypothetical protein PHYPSEUDO_010015 [Phytophthora pseudosyringae]
MDLARLAPGTEEVLNDLLGERGLTEWQVVRDVRILADSDGTVDIIYGFALAASLQEERVERKRKRKAGGAQAKAKEPPTWSRFLVLPAVSSHASPTLSIKRCVPAQQLYAIAAANVTFTRLVVSLGTGFYRCSDALTPMNRKASRLP